MEINLLPIALGLALVSLSINGVMIAGSGLWPQAAEAAKKQLPNVVLGLLIVILASGVVDYFR